MTLKTRQLANIAAELQTALDLAHVSDASRADIVWALLDGARTMMLDARNAVIAALAAEDWARVAVWAEEAEYQYQRGCALKAEWKRLTSEAAAVAA